MCTPCGECIYKYVHWFRLTPVVAYTPAHVLMHWCSRHLFRARRTHCNKCTYTRSCTPKSTVQHYFAMKTVANCPKILKTSFRLTTNKKDWVEFIFCEKTLYRYQELRRNFLRYKPETRTLLDSELVLIAMVSSSLSQPARARAAGVPFLVSVLACSWRMSSRKKVIALGNHAYRHPCRPAEGFSGRCQAIFGAPALVCWHLRPAWSLRRDASSGTASTSAAYVGASSAGVWHARYCLCPIQDSKVTTCWRAGQLPEVLKSDHLGRNMCACCLWRQIVRQCTGSYSERRGCLGSRTSDHRVNCRCRWFMRPSFLFFSSFSDLSRTRFASNSRKAVMKILWPCTAVVMMTY